MSCMDVVISVFQQTYQTFSKVKMKTYFLDLCQDVVLFSFIHDIFVQMDN